MDPAFAIVIGLVIGIIMGAVFGVLIARAGSRQLHQQLAEHTEQETALKQQQERYTALDREHAITIERLSQTRQQQEELEQRLQQFEQENKELQQLISNKASELAGLQSRFDEEIKNSAEKQQFFKESIDKLEKQFKATASELLINTGEKITRAQSEKLGDLMKPFRENLTRFEKEFKDAYEKETRDQLSLKEQIKHLSSLNQKLSDEAHALANALKGDSKTRGDWGEQMLEHILQSSGLREGHEYNPQASFTDEDGRRLQPDVIVYLPDDKCIIIDSKVSLNAWMEFVNADTDEQRTRYIKSFAQSVHNHVKSLSDKAYQNIYDIRTLDFVLMFIPIETAFLYALENDPTIYDEAHKKNIILVSPTTLMAVLKTIAVNWKHDRQDKNTLLIAKEAEKLLDKIYRYAENLIKARASLQATNNHFETACKQFATGRGNIKDSTEKLTQLGVKSAKKLGIEWEQIEEADEDDFIEEADADTDA